MGFKYEVDEAETRDCCLCKKPIIVLTVEGSEMVFDFKMAAEIGFVALRLHSFVCENWSKND